MGSWIKWCGTWCSSKYEYSICVSLCVCLCMLLKSPSLDRIDEYKAPFWKMTKSIQKMRLWWWRWWCTQSKRKFPKRIHCFVTRTAENFVNVWSFADYKFKCNVETVAWQIKIANTYPSFSQSNERINKTTTKTKKETLHNFYAMHIFVFEILNRQQLHWIIQQIHANRLGVMNTLLWPFILFTAHNSKQSKTIQET